MVTIHLARPCKCTQDEGECLSLFPVCDYVGGVQPLTADITEVTCPKCIKKIDNAPDCSGDYDGPEDEEEWEFMP